ncbi:hypothetical protein, partial [Aerococcus sp. Group 1]|uniref:hypothetical protein n=1 Tax=Aerococcus urinae (strain CCUG 59500 / ACS-120-V-Col10a) TaxID=2976812 RepID=UPI00227C320B
SIGLPWLFVYQKMVPMKSRWLPSTPKIIEPEYLTVTKSLTCNHFQVRLLHVFKRMLFSRSPTKNR